MGGGDGTEREGQENTCLFSPNSIAVIVKSQGSESQCTIELCVHLTWVFLPALRSQIPTSQILYDGQTGKNVSPPLCTYPILKSLPFSVFDIRISQENRFW